MGIPKFFRWVSERYPTCSQLIQANKIPEFGKLPLTVDNLYFDMNGIIHACSHPSDSVHFRLTEDQIFLSIFNYIDQLFAKIKPKKLLFMAVDGVAPRAKMNQQRARRFRTAKDANEKRKAAIAKGEELPEEPPFDSNCITPGTEFMCKLSEQLKYFVAKKVTEDSAWQQVQVILSGHEVPGEGEHKIMEYIRLEKSKPDYNPNVRHCLYGLDADLIMLGLLTHEPHFALLREEVTFGRSKKSASSNPENQNFFLMHLCLLREYLEHEFSELKESLARNYDFERIIDDFILMAFFVGNDFLPNLPCLHINEGALSLMFSTYKRVIVETRSYLHSNGEMNLTAVQHLFDALSNHEIKSFEAEMTETELMKEKKSLKNSKRASMTITSNEKNVFELVKHFVLSGKSDENLNLTGLDPQTHVFAYNLSERLGLGVESESVNATEMVVFWQSEEDEEDEESNIARARVIKRYDNAQVEVLKSNESVKSDFIVWKKDYYKEKLEVDYQEPKDVRNLVFHYVQGLQWVLYYYYHGVQSWEWFFPFHYAPKISDIKDIASFDFKFEKGKPFRPFDQLMGVLPAASQQFIPAAFRTLMTDPTSPIIHFYPEDFSCDMNGKKSDWEAIVKIPFIEENRLLQVLNEREKFLTPEERKRNTFGESVRFVYNPSKTYSYASSLPGIFPDILNCTCHLSAYQLPLLGEDGLQFGLCDGALVGVRSLAGFPSLHTIPHVASFGLHGVNVFNVESKNESIILNLENSFEGLIAEDLARRLVNKSVHIGWPFLREGKCVAIVDDTFRYTLDQVAGRVDVLKLPLTQNQQDEFYEAAEKTEIFYSEKCGALIGPVEIIAVVYPLKGMTLADDGSLVKDFDTNSSKVPAQMIVEKVESVDERYIEKPAPPLDVDFPVGSNVFFLGARDFGVPSEVSGYSNGNLCLNLIKPDNQELQQEFNVKHLINHTSNWLPSFIVCKKLGISGLALAKITSSMHMVRKSTEERANIGLCLKFDAKQKKVLGYTQKADNGWEFSEKAVQLIISYKENFPEIFDYLKKNPKKDFYEDADFFPQNTTQKAQTVLKWLKDQKVKEFDQVDLKMEALDKETVKSIEIEIDQHLSTIQGPPKFAQVAIKNVPRQAVLKPVNAPHRLSSQKFELGDRLIHVWNSGAVPLAAKGTVVGIDGKYLDVLFDNTFMGGSDLDGRCSPYRGIAVKSDAVLNLTRPQIHSVSALQNQKPKTPQNLATERRGDKSLYFKPQRKENSDAYIKKGDQRPKKTAWKKIDPVEAPILVQEKQLETGMKIQIKKKTEPTAETAAVFKETNAEDLTKALKSALRIGQDPQPRADAAAQILNSLFSSKE